MENIQQIVDKLKSLDLANVTDSEVISLLREVGNIAVMSVTIHPGSFILRGRPDSVYVNRNHEDQITYIKDPTIIPQYNRASLKGRSMFYGTTTTEDENYCQAMTIAEITSLYGTHTEDGKDYEEYITMGKWRVESDINLAVIAHHEDFHKNNEKLKNLHTDYLGFIKQFPERKNDFKAIAQYLSYEFAKEVKSDERYNYKISGAFGELATSKGLHGVMYPTAKDAGKGFNVAITPDCVNNNMKLEKVASWRIRKRVKEVLITPFLFADQFKENGEFIWRDPGVSVPEKIANDKLNGL